MLLVLLYFLGDPHSDSAENESSTGDLVRRFTYSPIKMAGRVILGLGIYPISYANFWPSAGARGKSRESMRLPT